MMDRIFISISKTLSNTDTTKTSSFLTSKKSSLSLSLSLSRHILCVQKQTTQMNTKGSVFLHTIQLQTKNVSFKVKILVQNLKTQFQFKKMI